MEEDRTFKMMVRKVKPMSDNGFSRLSRMTKINYKREVYKPLGCVIIDKDKVYDERSLACLMMARFGAGKYDALKWDAHTHKLKKGQLFLVELNGDLESKWNYEFKHTLGIARMKFWIGSL